MMKDGSADLRRIRDPEKAAAMSESGEMDETDALVRDTGHPEV